MKWCERILKAQPEAQLHQAATVSDLAKAQRMLGIPLPAELQALLLQTDGVDDIYSSSFLWPVAEIIERNLEFRSHSEFKTLYMPFDHLLFWGDAGNGDQFFYPILAGEIRRPDIYDWNHESDSRSWVAQSLDMFVERWLNGELEF